MVPPSPCLQPVVAGFIAQVPIHVDCSTSLLIIIENNYSMTTINHC